MSLAIYDCLAASDEDKDRGIAAAIQVFREAGVDPAEAHAACARIADDAGRGADDERLAQIWRDADSAAISACCDGWFRTPESAHLELI